MVSMMSMYEIPCYIASYIGSSISPDYALNAVDPRISSVSVTAITLRKPSISLIARLRSRLPAETLPKRYSTPLPFNSFSRAPTCVSSGDVNKVLGTKRLAADFPILPFRKKLCTTLPSSIETCVKYGLPAHSATAKAPLMLVWR